MTEEPIEESDSEKSLKKTRVVLIGLAIFGVGITFAVYATYRYYFHDQVVVAKTELWGQFGDFIGGILNPLVGLLALIGLLWTIYQNQRELSLSRESLRKSADALVQNNTIANEESKSRLVRERKDDLFKMIDMLHKEVEKSLLLLVEAPGMDIDKIIKTRIIAANALYSSRVMKKVSLEEIVMNIQKTDKKTARSLLKDHLKVTYSIARDLKQLKTYLSLYESEAKDTIVTGYYKLRFISVVRGLNNFGALEDKVLDYFEQEHMPKGIV